MRLIDAETLKKKIPGTATELLKLIDLEPEAPRMTSIKYFGDWISVKDRLPKEKDDVLILYERAGISGEKYREIDIESFRTMKHFGYVPLFWMPIPEPPKEADECNTD